MISDNERREVARRLRELSRCVFSPENTYELLADAFGVDDFEDTSDLFNRLADLIEPSCDPTERGIDSIYEWCFERLEGADGAEDYLYCTILSAIEEYRHPERVTARTARPVDREALLALAEEMRRNTRGMLSDDKVDASDIWYYEHLLRKACGEVAQ